MLISLKTITQETFQVEVEPTDTIKIVKEKIQRQKGSKFPVEHQRLVFAGKILTDEQTVADAKLDEKKFIIVMVTLPKSSTSPSSASTPSKPPSVPRATVSPQPTKKAALVSVERPKAETPAPQGRTVSGAEYERCVKEIVSMGYSNEMVRAAMQASQNDPDRAVDFLLSGTVPEPGGAEQQTSRPEENQPKVPAQAAQAAPAVQVDDEGREDGDEGDPLGFLRREPAFAQMRHVMKENPNNLPKLMEQIQNSNPRLHHLISAYQERFVEMLTEPDGGNAGQAPSGGAAGSGGQSQPQGRGPSGTGQGPSQAGTGGVEMNPKEREAVERLKAMGFPEPMVIEAYFACEKNENMAVNLLLQQTEDGGEK